MTRLTPLGWTCIDGEQTNFARAYFSTGETEMSEVNAMLRRFWEIDSSGIESFPERMRIELF